MARADRGLRAWISSITATSAWLLMLAISTVHAMCALPGTLRTSCPVTCHVGHGTQWAAMGVRTGIGRRAGAQIRAVGHRAVRALNAQP